MLVILDYPLSARKNASLESRILIFNLLIRNQKFLTYALSPYTPKYTYDKEKKRKERML